MSKKISLCAFALAALALELTANAATAQTPAPTQKQARQQFHVYGGSGTCKRSIRLLGTYDDASTACAAAATFRTKKLVGVRVSTGNLSPWSDSAGSYSVYGRFCKTFSLRGSSGFFWKAALLSEVTRRNKEEVEIIYHGDAK